MRETERRIQLYRARLPKIREKIIATLLVFAVSAAAMAVATFSWVTLSIAPEASGISTAVAANGNLEIALAGSVVDGNVVRPGESAIGDSTLAILQRNETWGNLVNLSDNSYGLSNMVLAPAMLNEHDLLNNPLWSMAYSADGRITRADSELGYTSWVGDLDFGQFEVTDKRGVRAITALVESESTGNVVAKREARKRVNAIDQMTFDLKAKYESLGLNGNYMDALSKLMVGYMANNIKNSTSSIASYIEQSNISRSDVVYLKEMYTQLVSCFEDLADIYAYYLNVLTYIKTKGADNGSKTGADLLAMSYSTSAKTAKNALIAEGYEAATNGFIADIDQFLYDYNILINDVQNIQKLLDQKYASATSVVWTDLIISNPVGVTLAADEKYTLSSILNRLTDVSKCKIIIQETNKSYTVGSIYGEAAMDMAGKDVDAIITNGILYNFENRCGARISTGKVTMTIKTSMIGFRTVSVYAYLTTSANSNYITNEKSKASTLIDTTMDGDIVYVGADTYGFVIDTWVRTNGANSYLILEGEPIIEPADVVQTVTYPDSNGKLEAHEGITIHQITKTTSTDYTSEDMTDISTTEVFDVYQREGDTTNWYYLSDNTIVDSTGSSSDVLDSSSGNKIGTTTVSYSSPPAVKQEDKVVGYSGVNRIWNEESDKEIINAQTSTTQGSGSCFTFYADTPEDMEQILSLLSAMKIAFVNGVTGELLAEAELDTDLYFAQAGKVIVPIQLINKIKIDDSTTEDEGTEGEGTDGEFIEDEGSAGLTDENGNPLLTITPLAKNEPILISSIVYIDGTLLTNEMAFAAADVQGSLNIQFGAYKAPDPLRDETLELQERSISATFTSGGDGTIGEGAVSVTFGENVRFTDEKDGNGNITTSKSNCTVAVKLAIEGAQLREDSVIKASFTRQVNSTQGTRQPEFIINTETLEGSYTFTAPGDYILRSVNIDGVDYNLTVGEGIGAQALTLTVTIPGTTISGISPANGFNYSLYTSEKYYTEAITINVNAGADGVPRSVKGVFMNEHNVTITTDYDAADGGEVWNANVTFSSSGTYTMQYVIIDGIYYDLVEEGYQIVTRDLHMGMTAAIYIDTADTYTQKEEKQDDDLTDNVTYKFYGGSHTFNVGVEIVDDAGNVIRNLNDVDLVYGEGAGAPKAENLRWNSTAGLNGGRYCGTLNISTAGIFTFNAVSIDGDAQKTIKVATRTPVITAQATEPLRFLSISDDIPANNRVIDIASVDNNTTSANVVLKFENAESATMYALFSRVAPDAGGNNKTTYYIVAAQSSDNGNTRTFSIPEKDGKWTLESVKMENVYDGTTFYTPANKITSIGTELSSRDAFDPTKGEADSDQYYEITKDSTWPANVKVIVSVTRDAVSFTTKYENAFMEPKALGSFSIMLKDFEDQYIPEISDVKIYISHNPGSMGYTTTDTNISTGTGTGQQYTYTLTDAKNGAYSVTPTDKVWFDGTYNVSLYYKINGVSVGVDNYYDGSAGSILLGTFEVVTTMPTVKITALTGTTATNKSHNHKAYNTGMVDVTTKYTDTSADVYYTASQSTVCGITSTNYTPKKLTITLNGLGSATSASLTFSGDSTNRLYSAPESFVDNSRTTGESSSYTWSADGAVWRWVGYCRNKDGNDDKTAAGKITADKLVLSDGTINYTVDLSTPIVINNPY